VPHSPQNLAHFGFSAWHRGHRIAGMSPKNRNQDAGKLGEYTEYRRRNSNAGSSGGNRTVSLDLQVFKFTWMIATKELNELRDSSGDFRVLTASTAPHFC